MQGYWLKSGSVLIWSVLVFSMFLFSCGEKSVSMKPFDPKPPEIVDKEPKPAAGSLYAGYDNLFSDDKAYKVGDTITIKIFEDAQAQGSMQSSASKDSQINYDFPTPTLLGKPITNKSPIMALSNNSKDAFKSSGNTKRTAKLIASITARVVKVYPNGNLFVVGKKIIKINDDTQVLRISGIVKPTYIEQDNSVSSSRISDMYVEYNGKGFIADHQKPGWLYRILTKVWPF